mmetsp:Transcript_2327/g.3303  ORF Transcript_2327/g.3303 Transcript_2327/m.3303 type:complete len:440 (+) Transcript_2327:34-1353(+)
MRSWRACGRSDLALLCLIGVVVVVTTIQSENENINIYRRRNARLRKGIASTSSDEPLCERTRAHKQPGFAEKDDGRPERSGSVSAIFRRGRSAVMTRKRVSDLRGGEETSTQPKIGTTEHNWAVDMNASYGGVHVSELMEMVNDQSSRGNLTYTRNARDGWHFEYGSYGVCKPERPLDDPDTQGVLMGSSAGEDSYFTGDKCVGIADGVGGWNIQGLSSARFSRLLMHLSAEYQKNFTLANPTEVPGPLETLQEAYDQMPLGLIGSTTACLATIAAGEIHTAVLGDSSYLILRNGSVIHKGSVLEHGFNHPYQLSDKLLIAYTRLSDKTLVNPEWPKDSLLKSHPVEEGDILLLVTDGILDNLWDHDIETATKNWMNSESSGNLTSLAKGLTELAMKIAVEPRVPTPFQAKASQTNGWMLPTGKTDDIAVIACRVANSN